MGGTFDPIHYGHLAAAEHVRDELGLDTVLFIPSGTPAFKEKQKASAAPHRFAMTALAIGDNARFHISGIEMERKGKSYTVDTLREIASKLPPKTKLYFIIGADAFMHINKWKQRDELFKLTHFAVTSRPGTCARDAQVMAKHLKEESKARIKMLEIPGLDISSSDIRNRVAYGWSIRYLVPGPVAAYIKEHKLYLREIPVKDIKMELEKRLSKKRYAHALSVAEEAKRLAGIHGADADRAYLAGLLHDAAKGMDDADLLKTAELFKIPLDGYMLETPGLVHSHVGAGIAAVKYNVADADVLNAIKYHTTGRPAMSLLEKIVFTADFTEPSRSALEGVKAAREYAEYDIDAAVIEALDRKMRAAGDAAHPLSRDAREYMTYHLHPDTEDY